MSRGGARPGAGRKPMPDKEKEVADLAEQLKNKRAALRKAKRGTATA